MPKTAARETQKIVDECLMDSQRKGHTEAGTMASRENNVGENREQVSVHTRDITTENKRIAIAARCGGNTSKWVNTAREQSCSRFGGP